jgi:hypothetical protein
LFEVKADLSDTDVDNGYTEDDESSSEEGDMSLYDSVPPQDGPTDGHDDYDDRVTGVTTFCVVDLMAI